jgi:large subunit ribosomal protein L22
MIVTAKLKHLRISPRKVRLVANLIKGLPVKEAEKQLIFLAKRASQPVLKLLKSAVANALQVNLSEKSLYIKSIKVDVGPTLKRWRPRAMGRATPINKRTSHITIVLEGEEVSREEEKAKKETAEKTEKEREEKKVLSPQEKQLESIKEIGRIEDEEKSAEKPVEPVEPLRPYPTTSKAKKKFFSRQTFGNVKKYFRRKSF